MLMGRLDKERHPTFVNIANTVLLDGATLIQPTNHTFPSPPNKVLSI